MKRPRVRIRRQGDAHLGAIDLPMQNGTVRIQTLGWDPQSALRRAGAMALQVTQNPAIAPFIPPQAVAVAQLVRALSRQEPDTLRAIARDPNEEKATRKLAKVLLRKMLDQIEREELSGPMATYDNRKRATAAQRGARVRRFSSKAKPHKARTGHRPKAQQSGPGRSRGQTVYTAEQAAEMGPRPYAHTPDGVRPPDGIAPGDYATVPPPGAPVLPGYQPGQPINPYDAMALQAWGAQSFDMQEQENTDELFDYYEDRHHTDEADDLLIEPDHEDDHFDEDDVIDVPPGQETRDE